MSRADEALAVMQARQDHWWTTAQVAAHMSVTPEAGRKAVQELCAAGRVRRLGDTFQVFDVRGHLRAYLQTQDTQEFTALGISEALPLLGLTEADALHHLSALAQEDHIQAWFCIPRGAQ